MRKSTKICAALGVVAGLGVAVAPLSVFAATPTRTDTLNVTVEEACTITVGTDEAEIDEALAATNIYDATVEPGGVADFTRRDGTSTDPELTGGTAEEQTFVINCNYAAGYKIVANGDALIGTDTGLNTDTSIPMGAVVPGNSFWAAKVTTSGNLVADNTGIDENGYRSLAGTDVKVASNTKGSAAAGDSFTVAYKVGAATELKAGHYSGSVSYTLVEGAN